MRALLSRGVFGIGLALIAAAACGYDPNPESGLLKCGPSNSCPESYSCMSGRCYRNGGGGGGGGGSVDKFIGHWQSDPTTAMRVRLCSDGTGETMAWNDYLDVARGPTTALTTNYYCDWNLDVAAAGNATTIHPGSMCTKPDVNDATIMYTWRGETLTLTTANGTNGTIDMSLPYSYVTSTSTGTCTMHFTGPMTKN